MATKKVFISNNIVKEYRKLLKLCKISVLSIDIQQVRMAFTMANEACKKQYQKVNEPLIFHALHVAQIVVDEIGLNTSSVICALLYKFIEEGSLTEMEIAEQFDRKISSMSSDLARISKISATNITKQSENFRKLLLTLISDVRVILIKLADRLYVMRNLEEVNIDEQRKIASETFDLYAPLGHRLGLYTLKSELEDLSMKYSHPDMYNFILQKIEETSAERNRFIKNFVAPIKIELSKYNIDCEVKSRVKSVFSIWNKMLRHNVEFEEVYDLFAVRIIIDSNSKNEKADCWRVFSIVTSLYQPNPERMRDWISVPKSNGYESLHTTIIAPGGKWVEVQIRTQRMNEIAEKGLAAHWKYKGQREDSNLDDLLNKIRDLLETPDNDNLNLIDTVKLSLYSQEIFVFTPKGDLKKFPKGSTILDFAFEVHSNVGLTCVGAKVNGKSVPIRHELNNGDKVEIITSKNQKPKSDWLEFVVTSKAKAKIKLALKEEKMRDAENGKEIFKRRLRNWKIPFNDLIVSKLLKFYKLKTAIDFYSMIASEEIDMAEIKAIILTSEKEEKEGIEKISDIPIEKIIPIWNEKPEDVLVIDEKLLKNVEYKLSKCCNPIFGDEIFGFVTINEGIKIHRLHCPNARQMINRYGYRVVKARWAGTDSNTYFQAAIKLTGADEIGILSKISDIIAKDFRVNLRSINVETNEGTFEGLIKLFVKDVRHLDVLTHKLLKIKGVLNATRIDTI